jgi:putative hydrolase of the HAD superfamily
VKFYRRLKPFKAISFDLDDTLYDNKPIIARMEQGLLDYLGHLLPESKSLPPDYWLKHKNACLQQEPAWYHDVTRLRRESLRSGIRALGYSDLLAASFADDALAYMLVLRNDFKLPDESVRLLRQLAQHFPLVAISNGNADIHRLGASHLFNYAFHAGSERMKKPDSQLFEVACQALQIETGELLHVGDCSHADIYGALNAGCQAIWIRTDNQQRTLKTLPHGEISNVSELILLK